MSHYSQLYIHIVNTLTYIGQIEQKEWHSNDRIQNGHQLAPVRAGRDVAIADGRDDSQRVKKRAREAPLMIHIGSQQLFPHHSALIVEQHFVDTAGYKRVYYTSITLL